MVCSENQHLAEIASLILLAESKDLMKKAVLSKPYDKAKVKTVICEKIISGKNALQAETFHSDNKATHKNYMTDTVTAEELAALCGEYMQVDLITALGSAEYKCSASGRTALIGGVKLKNALLASDTVKTSEKEGNNRKKDRILDGSELFLKLLGVSDENGRVYDKKQSKFRQINRFLEIIRDCEDRLPKDSIRICDLCCGKSYLSFAAYYYFSVVKGIKVSMTGVDLKRDVIEYCTDVAERSGFDGLEFVCADINQYITSTPPSLVISLHACDIATDIVLSKAIEWKTDVIISTPCCHHELNHNIDCTELSFITSHSMLRQKLCDAATDALRLCRLEASGYTTAALELIDPNETPKNIALRAFRKKNFDPDSKEARLAKEKYLSAKSFLCGGKDTSDFHF